MAEPEAALDDAKKVAFEERAAIREFNGGLDRESAEAAAAEELEETWPALPEFLRRRDPSFKPEPEE